VPAGLNAGIRQSAHVAAVRPHQPRLGIVLEVVFEDLPDNPPAKHLTSYGEHYFDALIEVARHPVGAAQINKGLATVLEVEDSAVLQEPAHDAAHSNLLTDASEVRAQ